jgi:hypothetical protein
MHAATPMSSQASRMLAVMANHAFCHTDDVTGEPYAGSDGVLIAKKTNQSGINAVQIEFFTPDDAGIAELMDGAQCSRLDDVTHLLALMTSLTCSP